MSQASISGFTFIRNGVELGFPFEASIRSLLPLVDEFVVRAHVSTVYGILFSRCVCLGRDWALVFVSLHQRLGAVY